MTQKRRVGWQEWDEKDVDWTAAPAVATDDDPFRELDEAETIPQLPVPANRPRPTPPAPTPAKTSLAAIFIAVGLSIVAVSIIVWVAIAVLGRSLEPAGVPVVIPDVVHGPDNNSAPLPPALPDGDELAQ